MNNALRMVTLVVLVILGAIGCEEGAMEEAGEEMDEAAEDVREGAEDATN